MLSLGHDSARSRIRMRDDYRLDGQTRDRTAGDRGGEGAEELRARRKQWKISTYCTL